MLSVVSGAAVGLLYLLLPLIRAVVGGSCWSLLSVIAFDLCLVSVACRFCWLLLWSQHLVSAACCCLLFLVSVVGLRCWSQALVFAVVVQLIIAVGL